MMDWTQIIITIAGILATVDLGRFAFVKLTRKEKEIDVLKKIVDDIYKPTINDLKSEIAELREEVGSLKDQVDKSNAERDECHKALKELMSRVDVMAAGRPQRNPRTGRYSKSAPKEEVVNSDGDNQ